MDEFAPALAVDGADPALMRGKILALEAVMREMPQLDIPIFNHFAPGIYLREMRAPAGATITGLIHKTTHFCILASGEMTVSTDAGMQRLSAPSIIKASPGSKRVAFCHSDVVWINVHPNPTNETDVPTLAAALVTDDFNDPALLAVMEHEVAPCLS